MINFTKTQYQGFTLSENDITNALATGYSFRNLLKLLKIKQAIMKLINLLVKKSI